ncbi:MAG: ATP synthase F1 subunit delta [Candidatus Riflebacteria bacterium HGW-Riflebacteria-2]|jgi:F-type H+-transporting ATPase subunit delta|nr:MAG: ATP synthase F1 subunit delta [Candidatus Riflebacteria bacterium HGW-Riflebacteria-2]
MNDTRKRITCKRYAEAFFHSIEDDDLEECFKDFEAFSAIYFGYEGLREILNHPTIHINRKIEMLQRIFGASARHLVVDFLCLLVKKERINLFEGISNEVERFYRRKNGIRGIVVRSAIPLEKDERKSLRETLSRKFGRIEVREIVDKSVVGGLVIHFGDQVIDESLRSRIKQLRELMIRVDAEWLMTLINQPSIAL